VARPRDVFFVGVVGESLLVARRAGTPLFSEEDSSPVDAGTAHAFSPGDAHSRRPVEAVVGDSVTGALAAAPATMVALRSTHGDAARLVKTAAPAPMGEEPLRARAHVPFTRTCSSPRPRAQRSISP